jgi:hypothetical protein
MPGRRRAGRIVTMSGRSVRNARVTGLRSARSGLLVLAVLVALAPPVAAAATHIPVSGTASGRTFGGVGASSGGGGNVRYLIDYPEPARSDILDYLFKPNYGAAIQILKVEIGGDGDSTEGAEASIEHTRGAVDCNAGYQWWLMRQARARNPAIRLYALAWGAPGWVGAFWSQNTIGYLLDWLRCARRHGLHVGYLGGNRNEGRYAQSWTERLRAALDAAGFAGTRLVVPDENDWSGAWSIAEDLTRDRRFSAATDVVGEHDVCGYPTEGIRCKSTATARRLRKPLWVTELGGLNGNAGAPGMARAMIRGYSQARLVGYVTWPLAAAIPPGLPHQWAGLVYARKPWAGSYRVNAMSYAIAMMTWFTAPGWRYVNGASGGLGGAGGYARGAYTTLRSPRGRDWSTVAETTTARAGQVVRFRVSGGLKWKTVHVWRTKPGSARADWMVSLPDIHPLRGRFHLGLRPGHLYTFTTLARHAKGSAVSPPPGWFGTYVERPGANPLNGTPVYLTAMDGAFEYRRCITGPGRCIQQLTPRPPIYWKPHRGFPYAVIGDGSLRDYTVASDVLFTGRGSSAGVLARFSRRGRCSGAAHFRGYVLALRDSGAWALLKNHRRGGVSVLRSGTLKRRPGLRRWHNLSLAARGSVLIAGIDGRRVGSARDGDRRYAQGIAGIEAGATVAGGAWTGTSWPVVQYRDLTVTP